MEIGKAVCQLVVVKGVITAYNSSCSVRQAAVAPTAYTAANEARCYCD
jgi:hypothetical protein